MWPHWVSDCHLITEFRSEVIFHVWARREFLFSTGLRHKFPVNEPADGMGSICFNADEDAFARGMWLEVWKRLAFEIGPEPSIAFGSSNGRNKF